MSLPLLKTRDSLHGYLHGIAMEIGVPITDRQFAEELDRRDELAGFRDRFYIPFISDLLDQEEIAEGTGNDCITRVIILMSGCVCR